MENYRAMSAIWDKKMVTAQHK